MSFANCYQVRNHQIWLSVRMTQVSHKLVILLFFFVYSLIFLPIISSIQGALYTSFFFMHRIKFLEFIF